MPAGYIRKRLSASLSRQLTVDYDYVWFVPSGAVKEDLPPGRRWSRTRADPERRQADRPIVRLISLSTGAQMLIAAINEIDAAVIAAVGR